MNTAKRLPCLTLATVFTVAMLLGVNALATVNNIAAPQLAQCVATAHS